MHCGSSDAHYVLRDDVKVGRKFIVLLETLETIASFLTLDLPRRSAQG